jgi:hypothetical protein
MSVQFNYDYMAKKGTQVYLSRNYGVHIKQEAIESWIKEGIELLNADKEQMQWFTTSGNSLVLVYREEAGDERLYVYITKIEHQGYVETNN